MKHERGYICCALCENEIYEGERCFKLPDIGTICERCMDDGFRAAEEPDPDDKPMICSHCEEEINGEDYYEIEGKIFCEECVHDLGEEFEEDEPDWDLTDDD